MSEEKDRHVGRAMGRGFLGRCPRCGEGKLFSGYLTVASRCAVCGEALGRYRAADGPAFFTLAIVGTLLVPVLGWSFIALRPNPLTLALVISAAFVVLTLVLLRFVKGAFIGFLWGHGEMDRGA